MMRLQTYLLRSQWPLWAMLVLLGGLALGTNLWSARTTRLAQNSQAELRDINALLLSVVNLETGIRGYALTHDPAFLEPYSQARVLFDTQLQRLRARNTMDPASASTPDHLRQLTRMDTLMRRWLNTVAAPEIGSRSAQASAQARAQRRGQGKVLIDAVREQVANYTTLELQEVQARERSAAWARQLNMGATTLGVLGAIVLSILSSVTVSRRLSRKFGRLADAAEHLAATETAQPVAGFHVMEAARLAQSFNHMAQKLERSHQELLDRNAELLRRNQEMAATNVLAEQLQTCLSLEEGHRVLAQSLPRLFPDAAGVLLTINASRNLLVPQVQWGDVASPAASDPHDCWALRRGQVYDPQGPKQSVGCTRCLNHPLTACFPLMAHGETLGILQLVHQEDRAAMRDCDHALASTLRTQIALGLANLKLRETLRAQSIRDPLTGLFNRRYIEEAFEQELGRARRHQTGLAVLMLDVDHFKRLNDQFGHEAGDAVLVRLGLAVQSRVRREDVVCRYGGEEFLVLLPGTALQQGQEVAELIRSTVAALRVSYQGQDIGALSVSVGVSAFPGHGETREALIASADHALYRAKQQGRNQVQAAGTAPL
ncbi:diguanylate cyclase [Deinococcus hohokamensis]|uniref:Diguanylate cyclase n=1 Tax=Deinococcus hohokamensis TaxID=309883 RepID=A0ABV9ID71_9DEIO